jgi:hypothetical protein
MTFANDSNGGTTPPRPDSTTRWVGAGLVVLAAVGAYLYLSINRPNPTVPTAPVTTGSAPVTTGSAPAGPTTSR